MSGGYSRFQGSLSMNDDNEEDVPPPLEDLRFPRLQTDAQAAITNRVRTLMTVKKKQEELVADSEAQVRRMQTQVELLQMTVELTKKMIDAEVQSGRFLQWVIKMPGDILHFKTLSKARAEHVWEMMCNTMGDDIEADLVALGCRRPVSELVPNMTAELLFEGDFPDVEERQDECMAWTRPRLGLKAPMACGNDMYHFVTFASAAGRDAIKEQVRFTVPRRDGIGFVEEVRITRLRVSKPLWPLLGTSDLHIGEAFMKLVAADWKAAGY